MTIEPPPAVHTAPEIDRRRVLALIDEQRNLLAERTPRSGEYYERARRVMPKGVPSSFQENDPWPVYVERGRGAQVWDVGAAKCVPSSIRRLTASAITGYGAGDDEHQHRAAQG